MEPQWHEWFSRGLVSGEHYLAIPAAPLDAICPALLAAMLDLEAGKASAQAPAPKVTPMTHVSRTWPPSSQPP